MNRKELEEAASQEWSWEEGRLWSNGNVLVGATGHAMTPSDALIMAKAPQLALHLLNVIDALEAAEVVSADKDLNEAIVQAVHALDSLGFSFPLPDTDDDE